MSDKTYILEMIVRDEESNEVIIKSSPYVRAESFEGAEEDLGKLQRFLQKVEHDDSMRLDEDEDE